MITSKLRTIGMALPPSIKHLPHTLAVKERKQAVPQENRRHGSRINGGKKQMLSAD